MNSLKNAGIVLIVICFISSCGSGKSKKSGYESAPSQVEKREESKREGESNESPQNAKDELRKQSEVELTSRQNLEKSGKKFIRTAEVSFKTKNVMKATLSIEDLVASYNGFITTSELKSEVNRRESHELNRDSIRITSFYVTRNNMVIRVPNQKLDSFLRDLSKFVVFLDRRIIKAEDVSISLLANQIREKTLNEYVDKQQKAIDTKSQDLNQNTNAQNNVLNRQIEAENNKIQKMRLEDSIELSTINLTFYQDDKIHQEMIENYNTITRYSNFWRDAGYAFDSGLWLGREIVLLIIRLWLVILSLTVMVFAWRYWRNSKKK